MLLLSLLFGQLFFNHMRASVCGPVWGCSCYLIAAIVITFELLSSHALSLLELGPGHPMGQFDGVILIYLNRQGQTSKVHRVAMAS